MQTEQTQPRSIPCKGHPVFEEFPFVKSNERIQQVASWIIQQGIKVSGSVQEKLERIIENPSRYRDCGIAQQVINTYEPEVR